MCVFQSPLVIQTGYNGSWKTVDSCLQSAKKKKKTANLELHSLCKLYLEQTQIKRFFGQTENENFTIKFFLKEIS